MRVVDAAWELRNLGVTTTEVEVEPGDGRTDIIATLSDLQSQYQVVRVPAGRVDVTAALEDRGFNFIEAAMSVTHNLRLPELPGVLSRLVAGVDVALADTAELSQVEAGIHAGMFQTDRVFLDPHFTADQAARRYVNWMRDEVARGAGVYLVRRRGQPVGFFLFRASGDVAVSALSGLFESAKTPGLGAAVLYLTVAQGTSCGLRTLQSTISANNLPVVKTHCMLGFEIVGINYVMVRHRRAADGPGEEVSNEPD